MKALPMLLCAFIFSTGAAVANESVVNKYIDNASEVGSAKFEFVFWDVYFATLYASGGSFDARKPYALSLHYLRDFDGKDIAERSAKEMKQQGFDDKQKLAEWENAMQDVFPDVKKGQTITGVADASGQALFYLDEQQIGVIADPDFTQKFFDIWLSEKTSEPKLRKKLLKL